MKGLKDTVLKTDPASAMLPDTGALNNGEPRLQIKLRLSSQDQMKQ